MTLKHQQRIFRMVSGKWYQRLAFWQWPELIREQHAALQQEARKQLEIRSAMVKLGEWIHATHRLDAPPRKGIRAILAGAKRGVALLLLLPALLCAQPAPILRNSWSTNTAGTPVQGLNNLSVTNLGSGTNWQFYNVGPRTIARLGDVTNIASAFTGDASGTNSRQGGSLVLTNLSNNPIPFTNIIAASTAIALGTNAGITYITNTLNTNAFQPAAESLTNWSNIPTGAMANVVSTTFLTNWANAVSNYVTAATNSVVVTNWINSRQPASANLTNWSLLATGVMANVVSTTFLTNWANSISNLAQTKQNGSDNLTNWSNIATGAMANIPAVTFLTNWANSISNLSQTKQSGSAALTNLSGNPNVATNILGVGNATVTSNNAGTWTITGAVLTTNANQFLGAPLSIKAGAFTTNLNSWGPGTNYGNLVVDSNVLIRAGRSVSNAYAGGVLYFDMTPNRTNLNATITTFTNLSTNSIPAHALTNNGDMVIAEWAGVMANASANTNQFRILYGSQIVIDTGVQISSNTTWNAEVKIVRTGNTEQLVLGHFEWGPGGLVPFVFTNVNLVTSQTNGLDTYIALQGAARRVGAHTNNFFRLKYEAAPE